LDLGPWTIAFNREIDSSYQNQAVISQRIYTSPSPNFQANKPASSTFMVFEWDQIYFSTVFDDLNIVKKVNMYSRYRRYIHEGKIRAKLFDLFYYRSLSEYRTRTIAHRRNRTRYSHQLNIW
jgi:hypothetical protein